MKRLLLLAAWAGLSTLFSGCVATSSLRPERVYVPGDRLVLTVRNELLDEGIGVETSGIEAVTSDGKMAEEAVQRVETKRSVLYGTELVLPVDVAASWRPGCVDISMKVAKLTGSFSGKDDKGVVREGATDEATSTEAQDELQRRLDKVSLHATLSAAGKVVASDVSGDSFSKENALWSEDGGITRDQCFGALSDAAAYLPPADVELGQTWQVVRSRVAPYHAYGFYMFTSGCRYSSEKSTCRAVSVESEAGGRIVTVRITGRRVPVRSHTGEPRRVDYMATRGELKFNLDTREVLSLHVEDKPVMLTAEDRKHMVVTYTTNMTLKKR